MKSAASAMPDRARKFVILLAAAGWASALAALGGDISNVPAPAQAAAAAPPGSPATATGNWGGLRDTLADRGITIGLTWVGEGFRNFEGGLNTRDTVFASTTDLNLTIDTQKALGWPGGKLYADLEDHAGQNPSAVLTGDLQVFDKMSAAPYLQILELYYDQTLFNGLLRIKIGKADANTQFSFIDNGQDFIDSSAQVTPALLGFPTTPDPLPGANVFVKPADFLQLGCGAYLANQTDRFLDFSGSPSDIQPTRNGWLFIAEADLFWQHDPLLSRDGNLKLGVWDHTGAFPRLEAATQQGAEGFYAVLDQTLWTPAAGSDETRRVRMFLEYGETDPAISTIYRQTGSGVIWTGFLPARPADEIGFSPEYAFLSPYAGLRHASETICEVFYKTNLTPWAVLQPDLQYIIHPGGQYRNALVGMVQFTVQF